jgi:hypothetical protein
LLVKDVGEEETLITELGEKEVDVRDWVYGVWKEDVRDDGLELMEDEFEIDATNLTNAF